MRTGVALGSNVGDRLANLRAARRAVVALVGAAQPFLISPIYETEPVDCEPGAQKFMNAVLELEFEGDPRALLEKLIGIEELLGRQRGHARNVSRKIDIDLLYYGDQKIDNEVLQLPHPRMHLREFVLRPLADVRPALILPGQTESVRDLLAEVAGPGKVSPQMENW
jgi:2-amino-4-hydroxy-6-hydroxymethyldihydropteridine diphosphokinase